MLRMLGTNLTVTTTTLINADNGSNDNGLKYNTVRLK